MWSDSVKVHPWVGSRYENPKNLPHKTLILGESNFTKPEVFTSELVQHCVENDIYDQSDKRDTTGFCRFSTKIRRIIFGIDESIGPNEFWQDVIFYNFVQFLVGEESRIRPTENMWLESVPAFLEIISTLRPARVLVLGKANWNNLLAHIEHEIIDQNMAKLKVVDTFVIAGYINHPSSSLTYKEWQPVAKKILNI